MVGRGMQPLTKHSMSVVPPPSIIHKMLWLLTRPDKEWSRFGGHQHCAPGLKRQSLSSPRRTCPQIRAPRPTSNHGGQSDLPVGKYFLNQRRKSEPTDRWASPEGERERSGKVGSKAIASAGLGCLWSEKNAMQMWRRNARKGREQNPLSPVPWVHQNPRAQTSRDRAKDPRRDLPTGRKG